jgi:hypothetical protein
MSDNTNIVPFSSAPITPVKQELGDELERDLEQSKKDMRKLAEIGMEAVEEAAQFASQSQQHTMYMSLSSLMKSTMEARRELIDTHKKKQELEEFDDHGPSHVTNQLVLQGTTTEMLDQILGKKKDDNDADV